MSGIVPSLKSIAGNVESGKCAWKDIGIVCWFSFGLQEFLCCLTFMG